MSNLAALRAVDLFAGLDDAELESLAASTHTVELDPGDVLFSEGDTGDTAFVITEGTVEVLKHTAGAEVLLAVRGTGDIIGEMALLESAPRIATVRAQTAASLIAIPREEFDRRLEASYQATRVLFRALMGRWRETESRLRQSERMAQLGTLSAGVAHEINNPAAAVQAAARALEDAVAAQVAALRDSVPDGIPAELDTILRRISHGEPARRLDSMAQSDAEAEVEAWLERHGVEEPWRAAGSLVEAGITIADLETIAEPHGSVPGRVALLAATGTVQSLLYQVAEGSQRVFAIVRALKGYAYLDEAPIQDVLVTKGIDDTLLLLRSKLSGITVDRQYDQVPEIAAYGSELNQVWTNLIDNATDAIRDSNGSQLIIRVFTEGDRLVVEFQDDGSGISDDVVPRVFDTFFTTKEPGRGTGLGLDISFGIVTYRHGGEITVAHTGPGGTTFRVELPLSGLPASK